MVRQMDITEALSNDAGETKMACFAFLPSCRQDFDTCASRWPVLSGHRCDLSHFLLPLQPGTPCRIMSEPNNQNASQDI
jgi:hypothetical protein